MEGLKRFFKKNWMLVLSFIYIVSPVDFIPGDMVTGIGLIDDMFVLITTSIYLLVRFFIDERKSIK